MVPDKPPSFMSYLQRPAMAMQSFHPKTVIVRMNSNSGIPGSSTVGGQIVRFAFGVPAAAAMEAQNLLPSSVSAKSEVEEMETEESVKLYWVFWAYPSVHLEWKNKYPLYKTSMLRLRAQNFWQLMGWGHWGVLFPHTPSPHISLVDAQPWFYFI